MSCYPTTFKRQPITELPEPELPLGSTGFIGVTLLGADNLRAVKYEQQEYFYQAGQLPDSYSLKLHPQTLKSTLPKSRTGESGDNI